MNSIHTRDSQFDGRLRDSVLAPHLEAYVVYFDRQGYGKEAVRHYLSCLAHFAQWTTHIGLTLCELDEAVVKQFLNEHLPRCGCAGPVVKTRPSLRAACNHLLKVLRECNAMPQPAKAKNATEEELCRFDTYLSDTCGLSSGTRRHRISYIRLFLLNRFGEGEVNFSALQPSDIRVFLNEPLEKQPTAAITRALIDALRSYLRYRSGCGDQVHKLLGAISSPARWSMVSLPRALSPTEIERLLNAFPPHLPSRRRGYAMVRCALDMGLRIGEIAKLELSDIDWHNGTITLRHNKSRREDILPMPVTTGEAIADYLQFERPATTLQAVFVRRLTPHDTPITADTVRRLIRDAYQRIGLTHSRTHALRHSVAQRLLEHGSSLKEVADVLRHRSLNTSLIYAKLDSRRLLAVALPWPGGAR